MYASRLAWHSVRSVTMSQESDAPGHLLGEDELEYSISDWLVPCMRALTRESVNIGEAASAVNGIAAPICRKP